MSRLNSLLVGILVILFAWLAGRFYLDMTDFVFAVYQLTSIAKVLPFIVVILGFWALLGMFGYFLLMSVTNIRYGVNFIIIFAPMSALPFILLGVPQTALNYMFLCRSSVIVFALLLVMSWFMQNALRYRQHTRFPYAVNMVLFMVLYAVHLFDVDPDLRMSVAQACLVFFALSTFFYFLISWVKDHATLEGIIRVMAIACIVQAVLSFFSYYYYVGIKGEKVYSFSGFLRDYELFAEYLAIHVPLLLFVIRNEADARAKKFFIAGLLLVLFVLIATAIRGALISLVVGMAYYFINIRKISNLANALKTAFFGIVGLAAALFAVYHLIPQSARIIERFLITDLSTLDSRRDVWLQFFNEFPKNPLLGQGMFYDALSSGLFWPHSTYFYYLLTLGSFGLANYLFLLFGILRRGFENARINCRIPRQFDCAVALNAALLIFIVDGFKVDYQRYSNYQIIIWMLFALVVAMNHLKFKTEPER